MTAPDDDKIAELLVSCFERIGLPRPTDGEQHALATLLVSLLCGDPTNTPMSLVYEFEAGKLREFSRRSPESDMLFSRVVVRSDGSILGLAELDDHAAGTMADSNNPTRENSAGSD